MLHTLLTLFATRPGRSCISAVTRFPMNICKASPCSSKCRPPSLLLSMHAFASIFQCSPHPRGCQWLLASPSPWECLRASLTSSHGSADRICQPRGSMWGALDLFEFAHGLSTWGAAVGAVAPEAALSAITGIVFILHLFGVVRVVVVLLLHYLLLLFLLGVLVILGVSLLLLLLGHHALLLLLALMIVVHHFADAPPGRGSPALAVAAASCASSSPCSCRPGPAPALTAAASPTGGAAAAAARLPLAAPPGRGGGGGGRRGLGSAGSLLLGPRRLRLGRGRPPAAAAAALPGAQPADGARRGRGARRSGGRRRLLLLGRPAAPAPHRWALAEGEGRGRAAREGARSPDRQLRASSAPRGGRGAGAGRGGAGPSGPRLNANRRRPAPDRRRPPSCSPPAPRPLRADWGKRHQAPSASRDRRARRRRQGARPPRPWGSRCDGAAPRPPGPAPSPTASPDRTRHRPPSPDPTPAPTSTSGTEPGADNGAVSGTDPQPAPGTDSRHWPWPRHRPSPPYAPLALFPSAGTGASPAPAHGPDTGAPSAGPAPGLTLSPQRSRWTRGRGLSQSSIGAVGNSSERGARRAPGRGSPRASSSPAQIRAPVAPRERLFSSIGTKQLPWALILRPCFDSSPVKPLLQLTLTQQHWDHIGAHHHRFCPPTFSILLFPQFPGALGKRWALSALFSLQWARAYRAKNQQKPDAQLGFQCHQLNSGYQFHKQKQYKLKASPRHTNILYFLQLAFLLIARSRQFWDFREPEVLSLENQSVYMFICLSALLILLSKVKPNTGSATSMAATCPMCHLIYILL